MDEQNFENQYEPVQTPSEEPQQAESQSQTPVVETQPKNKNQLLIIVLSIIAICGMVFGIVGMVLYFNNNATIEKLEQQVESLTTQQSSENNNTRPNTNKDYDDIYGYWLTKNGSYFRFDENKFYWWKTKYDLNDNYYSGDLEIFQGGDAVDVLGTTYSKILQVVTQSGGDVDIDDIYALKLYPTYLISGGIDKTDTLAVNFPGEDNYMLLSFIIVGDDEAQAYNYSSGDTYYLDKE